MKKQYNLMISEDVLNDMRDHCQKNGKKINFFIELSIKEKLEKYGI